jgi:hypothetical protein
LPLKKVAWMSLGAMSAAKAALAKRSMLPTTMFLRASKTSEENRKLILVTFVQSNTRSRPKVTALGLAVTYFRGASRAKNLLRVAILRRLWGMFSRPTTGVSAICRISSLRASGVLGRVTVSAPFLKLASILSVSTP